MRRSDQRKDAVFALYQRDVTGRPLGELLADAKPYSRELAEAVEAKRDELDELIATHSQGVGAGPDRAAGEEHHARRAV